MNLNNSSLLRGLQILTIGFGVEILLVLLKYAMYFGWK